MDDEVALVADAVSCCLFVSIIFFFTCCIARMLHVFVINVCHESRFRILFFHLTSSEHQELRFLRKILRRPWYTKSYEDHPRTSSFLFPFSLTWEQTTKQQNENIIINMMLRNLTAALLLSLASAKKYNEIKVSDWLLTVDCLLAGCDWLIDWLIQCDTHERGNLYRRTWHPTVHLILLYSFIHPCN